MKRLIIIVEGQTEEEFVKSIVAPYLEKKQGIIDITPIKIATSAKAKYAKILFYSYVFFIFVRINSKSWIQN